MKLITSASIEAPFERMVFLSELHKALRPKEDYESWKTWFHSLAFEEGIDFHGEKGELLEIECARSVCIAAQTPLSAIIRAQIESECNKFPDNNYLKQELQKQVTRILNQTYNDIVNGKFDSAQKTLNFIQRMPSCGVDGIIDAFRLLSIDEQVYQMSTRRLNEAAFSKVFKSFLSQFIPGAELVHKKSDGINIPDAWVLVNGELCPVEIKRGTATHKAVSQLLRYIQSYQCKKGFLVAQDITASITGEMGITFVQISANTVAELLPKINGNQN